ncbi:YidB family protein [Streptomyces sp. NPDC059552]|uniref:YidB family protein n=1 Tax=Streptomyces sp. NPDC059552 TaxID=3346862 RepID=UPI0036CBFD5F
MTMAGNDLGSLLGGLLGGGSGGQGGSGGAGNILGALLGALTGAGGGASGGAGGAASGGASGAQAGGNNPLGGLMDMLTKSGLADQAQSWLGTGDNKPVSGAQIAEAVPDEALQKAAAQAGVSPQEAADQIAQALPTAVDRLSPEGQLPSGSLEDIIRQQKF